MIAVRRSVVEWVLYELFEKAGVKNEFGSDLNKFIIYSSDEVFNKITSVARSTLAGKIDNTKAVILRLLVSWAPEARRTLRNVPEDVIKVIRDYLSGDVDIKALYNITRYLAIYSDRYGYFLILPSPEEFKSMEKNINKLVEFIVEDNLLPAYSYMMKYDSDSKVIKIGEKPVITIGNEREFLEKYGKTIFGRVVADKIANLMADKIKNKIGKALLLDKVVTDTGRIILKYKDESSYTLEKYFGVSLPEEYKKYSYYFGFDFTVDTIDWSLSITVKIYLRSSGDVRYVYAAQYNYSLEMSDDVNSIINDSVIRAVRGYEKSKTVRSKIMYLLRQYGYSYLDAVKKTELYNITLRFPSFDEGENSIMVSVNVEINDEKRTYFNIEKLKELLSNSGIQPKEIEFYETGIVWKTMVKENMEDDFVLKVKKLEEIFRESISTVELDAVSSPEPEKTTDIIGAYLISLFHPTKTTFDVMKVYDKVYEWLSKQNIPKIGIDKAGIQTVYSRGEEIILALIEHGVIKITEDSIIVENEKIDLTKLGYSKEEAKEIDDKIIKSIAVEYSKQKLERIESIRHKLPDRVMREILRNLPDSELEKIMASNELFEAYSKYSDILSERTLKSDNIVLKTLGIARFNKERLGIRNVKLSTEPGVPVIETPLFYVHVYDVKPVNIDVILYGKKERIGVIYRGRSLPDIVGKAMDRYQRDVEKVKQIKETINLGALVIPKQENPTIIRKENEEKILA